MTNVDTPSTLTHVSLCAGYGGIDLGLKRAIPALRTIAFAEIEAFACANLVAKMEAGLLDPAPLWTDLKTFPWSDFHDCVDILSGGYPCQPFSAAGKRLGADDPRHLWPYISAGIAAMRPSLCFFENVEGHISLGLPDVIEDLAGLGYRTTWGIFSASEVGAVHQRKRVFILAHRQCEGLERFHYRDTPAFPSEDWRTNAWTSCQRDAWPSRPGQSQHGWEPPRVVSGLENSASERSRRESGDALHEGWSAGETRAAGLPQNSERRICAAIADDQPAGRNGRKLGNSPSPRCPRPKHTGADCGDESEGTWREESERDGDMADPERQLRSRRSVGFSGRLGQPSQVECAATEERSACDGLRQIESPLGGDPHGPAGGVGYAQLCVTSDNRTDELRLLGNGVVPATAERAFRVLFAELT